MKRRRHGGIRKGAGRPLLHKERPKKFTFTTRITAQSRDLLEASARARDASLAEMAEYCLTTGLEELAERRKPKPVRALCLLIEILSAEFSHDDPKYDWRSSPYMFEQFQAAILAVLDALKPPGAVVRPEPLAPPGGTAPAEFPDLPDKRGQLRGEALIRLIFETSGIIARKIESIAGFSGLSLDSQNDWKRRIYGLNDAIRDLGLGKTVETSKEKSS